MFKSQQIADWFIACNRAELRLEKTQTALTPRDLQQLMFFAQGVSLAVDATRLFNESFMVSAQGPVNKTIQQQYPGDQIPEVQPEIDDARALQLAQNFEQILQLAPRVAEILNFTWHTFKECVLTLDDAPWNHATAGTIIKDSAMRKYFLTSNCVRHIILNDIF